MVDVNVNVKDPLLFLQELKYRQHAVVYVAETRRLRLFGVVESTGPVYYNVREVLVEPSCASYGTGRVELAELEETVEDRAVFTDVEAGKLAGEVTHVVWGYGAEEVHVVVRVETGEVSVGDETGAEDLEVAVEAKGSEGRARSEATSKRGVTFLG